MVILKSNEANTFTPQQEVDRGVVISRFVVPNHSPMDVDAGEIRPTSLPHIFLTD
jgi:hypothetical protein